jgi:transposase-like protein
MYNQSFRNQAVKECANGQSLRSTAIKYGVAETTLRAWIREYQERMAQMSGLEQGTMPAILGAEMPSEEEAVVEESAVVLNSVNIAVDGHDITISKKDVVRLMEVFYQFDK